MNKFMRALTKELLTIEDEMVANGAGNRKRGTHSKNIWSPRMAQQQHMYNRLLAVLRQCYHPRRRGEVKTTMTNLLRECRADHTIIFDSICNPPPATAHNRYWTKYATKARIVLRNLNKQMHVRARRRWLNMLKKFKHKREEQRKTAQTLKKIPRLRAEETNAGGETLVSYETKRGGGDNSS